jgi:phospholipid transport system transporter-binding protein
MTQGRLEEAGPDRWRLVGELDFASVPELWATLEPLLRSRAEMLVSLEGVSRTNSAALALLIEALDVARRSGCRLRYADLPADLLDLARMSRCEALLLA